MSKTPILYENDGERELPFKWVICQECRGNGHHSGGMGALTQEDMEDEDFRQDYLAGLYDKQCSDCGGSGKVKVADLAKMTKADRKAYQAQEREAADSDAIEAAERQAEHYMDCRYAGVNYWEN